MKTKVAHICTSKISYRILEYKLKELVDNGYDLSIISSNDTVIDETVIKDAGINQYYVEMKRKISLISDLKSIIQLRKLFIQEQFEIVHTHTAKAGIIGRIAAYFSRTPIIIHTTHGLPYYEGMNRYKYILYKNIEKVGGLLSTYVGSQNAEDLEKLYEIINKNKLYYEGNGVYLEKLDVLNESITLEKLNNIKKELNIVEKDIILFMGARFESIKNHILLLDVLEQLKKRGYTNFKCILAGDGPLLESIIEQTNKKNLTNHTIFLGKREDVENYIKLSDIVILTSLKEGIPRIIMEAMAMKKPIIATKVKGTKELVQNETTGLLSELEEPNAMVDNLITLFNDLDYRISLGINGRSRIEENFTERIVAKRITDIYEEAKKSNINT